MCGRFGLFDGIDDLAWHFNLQAEQLGDYAPRWNIAPTTPILTVAAGNVPRIIRWGIPGNRGNRPLFNARSETVHRLPSFRDGFRSARCLVPASGFYEWRKLPDGARSPVWIHRTDEKPLAFAGIIGGQNEPAAAIITTEPNSLMAPIHNRMPVILEPEDYHQWLHDDSHSPELRALMLPRDWPDMTHRPVSTAVNRATNDGPELIGSQPTETPRLF